MMDFEKYYETNKIAREDALKLFETKEEIRAGWHLTDGNYIVTLRKIGDKIKVFNIQKDAW